MGVQQQQAALGILPTKSMPTLTAWLKTKVMNNLFKILAFVAVAGLVVGLLNVGNDMFSGFCRAFGAVFFILAFITKAIDKAEHTLS